MPRMEWQKAVAGARDAITVKRVYGDPIERDGVTIIPAARVAGGGGGGGGQDKEGGGEGGGTGFGMWAAPAGAYVVRANGDVEWHPAVDRTAIILSVSGVMTAALFAIRAAIKRGH
jgi:uncharacterized spore protein YtfJ